VTQDTLRPEIQIAVEAAQNKQAADITVLKLSEAFADYFLLASGRSQPQIKAISEEIERRLHECGRRPMHREGKAGAEWLLLDYGSFVVHIFSERARQYYDLERLWRSAERITFPDAPNRPAPSAEAENDSLHP
jgi:ribosome-associated protein